MPGSSHRWATAMPSSTARRSRARSTSRVAASGSSSTRRWSTRRACCHRERGVPDDVSWATLADLGQQLVVHRKRRGTTGLDLQWWLVPTSSVRSTRSAACSSTCTTCRAASPGPRSGPSSDRARLPQGRRDPRRAHPRDTAHSRPSECDESFDARDDRSWASLPRARLPRRDLHVVAARRAARRLPRGRLEHRALPAPLPPSSTVRPTTGANIMLLRVRSRAEVDRRAPAAHDARAGDRGAPPRRRPWETRTGWLDPHR